MISFAFFLSFSFCEGKLTGAITAPVTGSWGEPAWTARVPKPRWSLAKRGSSSMGAVGMVILSIGFLVKFNYELKNRQVRQRLQNTVRRMSGRWFM